jgi:pimeloyl-ACP methyl ester carboxylesterase
VTYAEARGARLYGEATGEGAAIVFVHEFAGDHRSWEPQVRHFARRYRCITYAARGYKPSDVPTDIALYSQAEAVDDIAAVMRHFAVAKAHVVGLSMGGFAALHFGLRYQAMASALVVAGCGYGAEPGAGVGFARDCEALAAQLETEGMAQPAEGYAAGPYRVQFAAKDPRGYAEFRARLIEHSAAGSALTLRGVQARRPSLYDLKAELAALEVPTLIVNGDEDEPCLEPGLYLKRTIPSAGLVVLPKTGHTINLEEPAAFNRVLDEFFATVEHGRWPRRDPRSIGRSAMLADEDR